MSVESDVRGRLSQTADRSAQQEVRRTRPPRPGVRNSSPCVREESSGVTGRGASPGSCLHTGHGATDEAVRPPRSAPLPGPSDSRSVAVSPPSLWSCYAVPGSGHRRTPGATNLARLAASAALAARSEVPACLSRSIYAAPSALTARRIPEVTWSALPAQGCLGNGWKSELLFPTDCLSGFPVPLARTQLENSSRYSGIFLIRVRDEPGKSIEIIHLGSAPTHRG